MKFNSQICTTKEQSERLLALGLKKETADMAWSGLSENPICYPYKRIKRLASDLNDKVHPAWSLHRLIEIANLSQYWIYISGNWYEEVIATIQSKIHIGELNKEYLEK